MVLWGSMEFHGNLMDLHGVPWNHHGISMEVPWNICGHSMGALNTEFHGM